MIEVVLRISLTAPEAVASESHPDSTVTRTLTLVMKMPGLPNIGMKILLHPTESFLKSNVELIRQHGMIGPVSFIAEEVTYTVRNKECSIDSNMMFKSKQELERMYQMLITIYGFEDLEDVTM